VLAMRCSLSAPARPGTASAPGIEKLDAVVGVFVVSSTPHSIGLRGLLVATGVAAVMGYLPTVFLLKPARRTPGRDRWRRRGQSGRHRGTA
jgi:hypothetical protein